MDAVRVDSVWTVPNPATTLGKQYTVPKTVYITLPPRVSTVVVGRTVRCAYTVRKVVDLDPFSLRLHDSVIEAQCRIIVVPIPLQVVQKAGCT